MRNGLRPKTYLRERDRPALFLALGGATAYAASTLGKNSVGGKQLKKNAVTGAKSRRLFQPTVSKAGEPSSGARAGGRARAAGVLGALRARPASSCAVAGGPEKEAG